MYELVRLLSIIIVLNLLRSSTFSYIPDLFLEK